MNRILLTGNLVKDVKLEKTKNNKPMLKNVIAVKDNWNTEFEKTYFINIECLSKDALKEFKQFKKGSLVEIEGKLVVENYKDKEGNWKNFTKVVVFQVRPIEFKKKNKDDELVDWDEL